MTNEGVDGNHVIASTRGGCWRVLALALLLVAMPLLAQSPTGDIRGSVTDPSGAVVPNATVKVTEVTTGRVITVPVTNAGLFSALHLLPGNYKVVASAPNFSNAQANLVVQAGQVSNANLQLKVGQAATTVEVTAAGAVQPDTTDAKVDGVVTSSEIVNLPLDQRNFLDLAATQPGVTVRDGGNIDPTKTAAYRTVGIDGRSGTGTRVQLDGIDITDETVGTTTANMSADSVQEFQLQQANLDISTSLTSSGSVSIISRTGTNGFHGSGFWFYRNQDMGARPGFSQTQVPFSRHQYGFRVGGPFIKNKVFWFLNGEKTDQTQQSFKRVHDFTVNGANCLAGCFAGSPFSVKLASGRLDANLTDTLHAFYHFNHSDDLSTGGDIPTSPFQNVDWTNVHIAGLDWLHGRTTHSVRFGYVNFNNRIVSQSFAGFSFPTTPSGAFYNLSVGDLTFGPNGLAPQQTDQDNYQARYDGSFMFGRHTLRYGFEFNHIVLGGFANFAGPLSVSGIFTGGSLTGTPGDPLSYQFNDFTTGPNNGFFTIEGCHGFTHGCHKNNRIAWYLGDTWKVLNNLTFSFGTRWEYDTGYFNAEKSVGVTRPDFLNYWVNGAATEPKFPKTAFSPQIGVAWDPFGDGKTSVRAGFSLDYEMNIYNNLLFDQNALIPSGIGPDVDSSANVVNPDGTPITPAQAGINVGAMPVSCQGAVAAMNGGDYSCMAATGNTIASVLPFIDQLNSAIKGAYANYKFSPTSGPIQFITQKGNTFGFLLGGNRFKIPYATQINFGVQRQLWQNNLLSVDFIEVHGVHQGFLGQDFECRRCASTFNAANAAAILAAGGTLDDLAQDSGAFPGRTPDPTSQFPVIQTTNFLRARIVTDGGFSKYLAMQVRFKGRVQNHFHNFIHNGDYSIGYTLSRNLAIQGSTRTEFLNNAEFKLGDVNSHGYFGYSGLDHTHMINASVVLQVPLGFTIGSIVTLQSAPPVTLDIPDINLSGAPAIFSTDLYGQGSIGGGAPVGTILPGTREGSLGRDIKSWAQLNQVITNFNNTWAGKLTPAGQALVNAGLMTPADLAAQGGTVPTIPLVPTTNPWPFNKFWNADFSIMRPIKLGFIHEGVNIEPIFQIFNLFNHSGLNTYSGLNPTVFGNLNYDYSAANNANPDCAVAGANNTTTQNCVTALQQFRGRNSVNQRLMQVGVRLNW